MRQLPALRTVALAAASLVSASILLVACGGGGSADPAATTAAGSSGAAASPTVAYGLGPIDGFGSIVVGGVRYDESRASIVDESGATVASSQLKLGMMVQVQATSVDSAASSASASTVRVGNEVVGPVSAVNASAGSFTVMGQTVMVSSATVFDSSLAAGLSAISVGSVVEVHGVLDAATQVIAATRIEAATGATSYQLRGTVASLDTAAKTFRIGSQLFNYASLATVPSTLANGLVVKVRVATAPVAGAWVVQRLGLGQRAPEGTLAAATVGHLEGVITVFRSVSDFEIGGVKVDARNATVTDNGVAIALGTRVEVRGTFTDGVLVATTVKAESEAEQPHRASAASGSSHSDSGSGTHAASTRPLELHGAIATLNTTAKTFVLRGITVSYASTSLVYRNGAEANLAANASVSVKGVLASDGQSVVASVIEFR